MNKKAFTLVEILLAMFIIATVAVLIIPNVAATAERNLFVTQLKKTQNDLQQAMILMMSKNQGSLQAFCVGAADGGECLTLEIRHRLDTKIAYKERGVVDEQKDANGNPIAHNDQALPADINSPDDCPTGLETEARNACYQYASYSLRRPQTISKILLSGIENAGGLLTHPAGLGDPFFAVNLANGSSVSTVFNPACDGTGTDFAAGVMPNGANFQVCGYMEVDLNAGKEPNMVGKDIHYFWIIDKDGIVPFGEIDGFTCQNVKTSQNLNDVLGCTARILREGRINYY